MGHTKRIRCNFEDRAWGRTCLYLVPSNFTSAWPFFTIDGHQLISASNIYSHQHLMGPALMAGAHAKNGISSPQLFHLNHCYRCVYMHFQPIVYKRGCIVGCKVSELLYIRVTSFGGVA